MAPSLKDLVASGQASIAADGPARPSLRQMVESGQAQVAAKEPAPSEIESFLRGASQGASFGFGDELWGGVRAVGDSLPTWLGGDDREESFGDRYRRNRDQNRADNRRAQEANPKSYLGGEIIGGVAVPVPGGAATQGLTKGARLLRGIAQGAGMGAVYGLGSSEADVTKGNVADAVADFGRGGLIGAAGGALAEGVVSPLVESGGNLLRKGGDALRARAQRGIDEAAERATARGVKEGTEEVASLTGALGAETQKGSRMTENIRRIPGDAAQATPEGQAALMQDAARIARERAEEMLNRAKAEGLEDVPDRIGEFLTKGSRLDKAQKARGQAQRLLEGAQQLERDAEKVLSGEISADALNANLNKARDIAMESAPFKKLEGTVLSENLRNLPDQVGRIEGARAARDVAVKNFDANVKKRAADLLSGRAAKERAKELAVRYALPLAGGTIGQELGDEYGWLGKAGGGLLGYKLGGGANAAIGSLAGAGLRPGFQALYRTVTQYPAVSNALWRLVEKGAPSGPGMARALAPLLKSGVRTEELQGGLGRLLLEKLERKRLAESKDKRDGVAER